MTAFLKSNERQTGIKMKKIICLILALACVFCFASCAEEVPADQVFFDVVSASEPKSIITVTGYKYTATGTNYTGEFKTYLGEGDSFTFEYEYLDRADPLVDGENATGSTITRDGKVKFEGGKYYDMKNGGALLSAAPDAMAMNLDLNITRETLGTYSTSNGYKLVETSLDVEGAKALLGIELKSATTPIQISIETDGTYLRWVRISYSTANADVKIITSYSPTLDSSESGN